MAKGSCMANIIIDGWLLSQTGHGMASYATALLQGLSESSLRDRLRLALPSWGADKVRSGLEQVSLSGIPRGSGMVHEAWWQLKLGYYAAVGSRGDILLALSPFASLMHPQRSIVVCHDLIPLAFPRYLGKFFYRKLLFHARLRWMRHAQCVITDSSHARTGLLALGGFDASRVVAIHCWAPAAFSPADATGVRAKYRLPTRYWLYLGGYDYRKNVECLIQAYDVVRHRHPDAPPLVLAGCIPTDTRRPVCDIAGSLLKSNLQGDDVVMPGYIDDADLPGLYSGAELFIYPSLAEGFGLPPVEAMSCGCPALVADNTSLREVVVDRDYRFPGDSPEVLSRILCDAVRSPRPLNPGFNRDYFGPMRGIGDYVRTLEKVCS